MVCSNGVKLTELEFVQQLNGRQPDQCLGLTVRMAIPPAHLSMLEQGLDWRFDELWNQYDPNPFDERAAFTLCVFHWVGLCHHLRLVGISEGRNDWIGLSLSMLTQISRAAKLDPKEISNLLVWRRVTLT